MKYQIRVTSTLVALSALALIVLVIACRKDPPEDMTKPRVIFMAPEPFEYSSLLKNVSFSVDAQAFGSKTIDRVEFYLDDVLLPGGRDFAFPFERTQEFTEKYGVPRKITAYAYDNLGYSDSTSIWVTIFNGIKRADAPTSRYGFSTHVVKNKIYVIGGNASNDKLLEVYDPLTDTWTKKASSQYGHFAFGSCVIDDIIYVFGGDVAGEATRVEAYDPATDTWSLKAPIPADMGVSIGANAAAAANGKAYLMGGLVNPTPARIAEYDPATDSWRLTNSYKLQFNGRAVSLNNTIYFMGGCSVQALGYCEEPSNALQVYDPIGDQWISKANMLAAHTGHAVTAHNGKIYVMGGLPNHPQLADRFFQVYDPATDQWKQQPSLPYPRINFGCASANGKIYILAEGILIEHTPE